MKTILILLALIPFSSAYADYDDDITVVEACESGLAERGLSSQEIDSLLEIGGEPTEIRPGVWHLDMDVLHCLAYYSPAGFLKKVEILEDQE